MTNLEKYDEVFIQNFRVDKSALTSEFRITVAESWDSLAHMQLIFLLEDKFGIKFNSDDILELYSYDNGKEILKKYGVEV
jgi:acyl carrier protein